MAEESGAPQHVTVVYALPDEQYVIDVVWHDGMTAAGAVDSSGVRQRFAELGSGDLVLGIYGRRVAVSETVRPGDRVEICRPLQRDPRELRRLMTAVGGVVGQREK